MANKNTQISKLIWHMEPENDSFPRGISSSRVYFPVMFFQLELDQLKIASGGSPRYSPRKMGPRGV